MRAGPAGALRPGEGALAAPVLAESAAFATPDPAFVLTACFVAGTAARVRGLAAGLEAGPAGPAGRLAAGVGVVAAFEREVAALAAAGGFRADLMADLTAGFADVLAAALGSAGTALAAALGSAGTALTAALGAAGAALTAALTTAGAAFTTAGDAFADAALKGLAEPGLEAF